MPFSVSQLQQAYNTTISKKIPPCKNLQSGIRIIVSLVCFPAEQSSHFPEQYRAKRERQRQQGCAQCCYSVRNCRFCRFRVSHRFYSLRVAAGLILVFPTSKPTFSPCGLHWLQLVVRLCLVVRGCHGHTVVGVVSHRHTAEGFRSCAVVVTHPVK